MGMGPGEMCAWGLAVAAILTCTVVAIYFAGQHVGPTTHPAGYHYTHPVKVVQAHLDPSHHFQPWTPKGTNAGMNQPGPVTGISKITPTKWGVDLTPAHFQVLTKALGSRRLAERPRRLSKI